MNSLSMSFPRFLSAFLPSVATNAVKRAQSGVSSDPSEETDGEALSLSQEALDRLAKGEEASAGQELLTAMKDAVKASADQLKSAQRAANDPARRVQEAKDKLKLLFQRLQRAILMGDKRSVAAIAREAAALAREVASAVKDASAYAKEDAAAAQASSVASVVGESAQLSQSAEASLSESSEEGGASQDSANALNADPSLDPEGTPNVALDASALPKQGGLDEGFLREVSIAIFMVRSIVTSAKAALKPKVLETGSSGERSHGDRYRQEVAESEEELEQAVEDIQQAILKAR